MNKKANPMTGAERQALYRQKKQEEQTKLIQIVVPKEDADLLEELFDANRYHNEKTPYYRQALMLGAKFMKHMGKGSEKIT